MFDIRYLFFSLVLDESLWRICWKRLNEKE